MTARSRQAIVWLSYLEDPEADAAFLKLSDEAQQWGRVIKVQHNPQGSCTAGVNALGISDGDLASALPARFEQMQRVGLAVNRGFCDLLQFAVIQKHPDFEHYWFIEYDVDFTGTWSTFFSEFDNVHADLLGTNLYPQSLWEGWVHWAWFKAPSHVHARNIGKGFFPINRVSKRFCQMYRQRLEGWEGHWEALFPSIALDAGLRVEDIGGEGPMTPKHRRNRFYTSTDSPPLDEGTFRAHPPVDRHYFPNRVDALRSDHLWHPIKTDAFRLAKQRLRAQASGGWARSV